MAEGEGSAKSIGGILKAQTGPLPNWVWLVVIAGGIAAVYIVPKFLAKNSSSAADATTTDAGTSNSGLGLAIDPTTGLPYAVEGLVPSGATVATQTGVLPPTPTTSASNDLANNPFYPILPPNTQIPSATGSYYQYGGQWYTIVSGPEGRIWGALGKMSAQQAQNTPISATTKRLLIEPASAYNPAWPGGTTQTRVA